MKRSVPFHPALVCLVPALNLLAANTSLLPGSSVVRPVAVCLGLALVLWGLAWVAYRDWEKAAVFASCAVSGLFAYDRVAQLNPDLLRGTAGVVGFALLLLVVSAALGQWLKATRLLNLFSAVLVGVLAVNLGSQLLRQSSVTSSRTPTVQKAVGAQRLPDVYYIVLDGFGREDVLKQTYPLAGGQLAASLRERGFYVADRSHANYCQTELSLASSLNMEHLSTIVPGSAGEVADRSVFDNLVAQNSVVRSFTALGYMPVAVTTGFPAIRFEEAASGYSARTGMSLIETALVQMTPLGENPGVRQSAFVRRREWLRNGLATLEGLAGDGAKPKFVVAHILAPHPPFVFGPTGEPLVQVRSFGYMDGSDYYLLGRTRKDYIEGYSGQAAYIGRLVTGVVDTILAMSKTPPVIILQGDHGPKSELHQNEIGQTNLRECMPILNAFYGPDALKERLYPEVTPVNTFRIVLGHLTGNKPTLLPDRSYYSPFGNPMELTDVTDRLSLPSASPTSR